MWRSAGTNHFQLFDNYLENGDIFLSIWRADVVGIAFSYSSLNHAGRFTMNEINTPLSALLTKHIGLDTKIAA
jgi:hypothetical protein